ncbi:FAD-dependent oxidoreductase [Microbacterium sp. 1P06AB]|uniref:FAD-dependent oxidoreductase n=1 Tax=Microbacterium sp. 1P06AB TaxID=3132289 RepID=UPI0039A57E4C
MRVLVSGAGLGGLVLAHALRDHAEVVVVERDASALDTGGYRIALTPEAVAVMRRHVPGSTLDRIRRVSDGPGTFSQFTVANARLRPLVVAPEPAGQERMLCQRRALRSILAEGLEGVVRFAAEVTGAEQTAGGAALTLADGSSVAGDLVVAADGADSPVVRALGATTSTDTGLVGIAGSTPLAPGGRYPSFLRRGPGLALDRRGLGMFLSLASVGMGEVPQDLREAVGPPSVVWGLIARRTSVPETRGATAAELVETSLAATQRWHPWLADTIAASDPDRTAAFGFRAASLTGRRFPWRAPRITAIGDAVHAMPPTGGRAGSTAIRSAGALADEVIRGSDLDEAVARYQAAVDDWAVPAIRESLGPVTAIRALAHPLAQAVAGPALSAAGAVGALGYRRALRV